MLFKSLRWQIQIWQGLLLTLITVILLVGFYRYQRTILLQDAERELSGLLFAVLPHHLGPPGRPNPPPDAGPPPQELPPADERPPENRPFPGPPPRENFPNSPARESTFEKDIEARGYYTSFWTVRGDLVYHSPGAPPSLGLPEHVSGPHAIARWNGTNYEFYQVLPRGDVALIGMPGGGIEAKLRLFALKLVLVGTGVICFGVAVGAYLSKRIIRPIEAIASTAEQISAGDHARRIASLGGDDELSRLARVLNATFDRLAKVYEKQVRFTADASHELRTPVSVILAQTQMTLGRERDAAAYRESLEICQRAALRMKDLLGDLMELSRYDAGEPRLLSRQCDLAEVVRESLEFIAPLAAERRAVITSDIASVTGHFDPINLSHVFINLLINAIKHNSEDCRIDVTLRRVNGAAQFVVADHGQGISAEALPHIFDRFYRVEEARTRVSGGSGLGLSIVKAIVEAHGGAIVADSQSGQGTTFTLTLPDLPGASS